jgi:peptidoglycan/LPS O-acetylase OafA/YrhL
MDHPSIPVTSPPLVAGDRPSAPGPKVKPAGSRIGELDALRGIAALAVVFHHLTRRFFEDYGRPPDAIPAFPIDGNQGVFLFFIISGFVITQTLGKTRRARDFAVSRFSRIFPSFWFGVLLTWAVVTLCGLPGREVGLEEMLVNLTMLQDHFHVRQVDYVYWSLTMELTFYALAFIAHIRGWLSRHPHRCAWAWLGFSAALVILKRGFGFEIPWNAALLTLPFYAPLFVAGILFHLLFTRRGTRETYAALACCFILHNAWNWHGKTGLVLSAAMFACFLLLVHGRLGFLRARPLLFLGMISYPLYLLHNNIGMVVIRELMSAGMGYNLALVVAIAAVIALSTAVTLLVERPAMKWVRRRFETARAPA